MEETRVGQAVELKVAGEDRLKVEPNVEQRKSRVGRHRRGIYKRGKIYWVSYACLDGHINRESSRSDKYKDAETLLIKRKQSVRDGKLPEVKRITNHSFSELAGEYKKWAQRQRAYSRKENVVDLLIEIFGQTQLRRFDTRLLEQFQTEKLAKGKKAATVNRHLATLKHMFTKACEWDMVEEDVLKRVRRTKLLEENNRRLRFLSREDCAKLIAACDPHLRPIVITALNTGMRKGEILSLKWEHVDLVHGFILLDITKNGERREVPINETLRETLTVLFKGTKERPRRLDVPHVFYDAKTVKAYGDVKKSFASACKRAGVKDFKFHDLRHTFASHLVMQGVDLTTVKELLGHKTITMTLRYAHLAPSHKIKAVSVLDDALMAAM